MAFNYNSSVKAVKKSLFWVVIFYVQKKQQQIKIRINFMKLNLINAYMMYGSSISLTFSQIEGYQERSLIFMMNSKIT